MSLESAKKKGKRISGTEKGMRPAASMTIKFDSNLPEEVWEMILNNLTDDADRTNCCRAFPLFDRILTRTKPVWMFKQILLLLPRGWAGWAGKRNVLSCRGVCKQWRADIDQGIHTNPKFWSETCLDGENTYNGFIMFDDVAKLNRFINLFDGHSDTLFISRNIRHVEIKNRGDREFPPRVLDLMSNFGEHIWTLEFHLENYSRDFNLLDSYSFFQQVLTMTPNLRHLIIYGIAETTNSYLHVRRRDYRLFVARNPIPTIPTLETFWAGSQYLYMRQDEQNLKWKIFPFPFINMLTSACATNLKEITMRGAILGELLPRKLQLPKLAYLDLQTPPDGSDLEKLLRLTAPLEKLQISRRNNHASDRTFNFSTLMKVLQNFPSLEEVKAYNFAVKTADDEDLSHLSNTTLQRFTLSYHPCLSLNFLQVFKALRELTVSLKYGRESYLGRNEGEGEVQFYKMLETNQPYESNIWSLIPSLQRIYITCYRDSGPGPVSGNREEYDKYQASRVVTTVAVTTKGPNRQK